MSLDAVFSAVFRGLRSCFRPRPRLFVQPRPVQHLQETVETDRYYIGIYRRRSGWAAQIRTKEGRKYLGQYDTPEEAAWAYDAALDYYGITSRPRNFPKESS